MNVFVDVLCVGIVGLEDEVLAQAYRDVWIVSASKTDVEADTVGSSRYCKAVEEVHQGTHLLWLALIERIYHEHQRLTLQVEHSFAQVGPDDCSFPMLALGREIGDLK